MREVVERNIVQLLFKWDDDFVYVSTERAVPTAQKQTNEALEASQIIATIPKTSTFVIRDIESIPKGIGACPRKPGLDPYVTNRRPRRKLPHGFHILLQVKTKSEFLRLLLHIIDESCTHFDISPSPAGSTWKRPPCRRCNASAGYSEDSEECILFDEINAISAACKQLERLSRIEGDDEVLVIGATNRPDALDPALRKAS
ncbi:hypothetical protein pipiens_019254 [Culex pipiens pipiens]|uniref:ATPase AAA-type core domain-containing protein n=1 Tax=Culex pipiens pipiens TaxID=38569 RepID=A0ABD1DZL0_CULPP